MSFFVFSVFLGIFPAVLLLVSFVALLLFGRWFLRRRRRRRERALSILKPLLDTLQHAPKLLDSSDILEHALTLLKPLLDTRPQALKLFFLCRASRSHAKTGS